MRDFDYYLKSEKYSSEQLKEIYKFLESGVDLSLGAFVYNNPAYSAEKMRLVRLALVDGLDISSFANPCMSYEDMLVARHRARVVKLRSIKSCIRYNRNVDRIRGTFI